MRVLVVEDDEALNGQIEHINSVISRVEQIDAEAPATA